MSEVPELKPEESVQDYTTILPSRTAPRILDEINQVLKEPITYKTVLRVLKGESPDSYGILPIAARIAKDHAEALATLQALKNSHD